MAGCKSGEEKECDIGLVVDERVRLGLGRILLTYKVVGR